MLKLSRNFILTFLVLLQLFAPLVHAHVDDNFPSAGLHLPGLELQVMAVQNATMQASEHYLSNNSVIVGIGHGLKEKAAKILLDAEQTDFIEPPEFLFKAIIVKTDSNFSPHRAGILPTQLIPSFAPRAPPSL